MYNRKFISTLTPSDKSRHGISDNVWPVKDGLAFNFI